MTQKLFKKLKLKLFGIQNSFSLIYHSISPIYNNEFSSKNIHNIIPEDFEKHMIKIKKNYTIVFIDELFDRVKKNKSINNLCSITFDDGYKNVLKYAYPILKKHQVPATLFTVGSMVKEKYFWRDQIRTIINENKIESFLRFLKKEDFNIQINPKNFYAETKNHRVINSKFLDEKIKEYLKKEKINQTFNYDYINKKELSRDYEFLNFGNHTYNHYVLSSLSIKEQKEEILNGKIFLEENTNNISKVFSVPFGGFKFMNIETTKVLEELKYEYCCLGIANKAIKSEDIDLDYKNKTKVLFLNRYMPEKSLTII